jgi:uncharacterized membrane protein
MAGLINTLVGWFAPWQALFSDSKVVDIGVTSVHLLAVLIGGGLAVSTDRATLRALRGVALDAERQRLIDDLATTHRPVLIALGVLFVSGLALVTADIQTFAHSPAFLVKMSLVVLLLINGGVLVRTERSLRREPTESGWRRLHQVSWISLVLWLGIVVAGVTLVNS